MDAYYHITRDEPHIEIIWHCVFLGFDESSNIFTRVQCTWVYAAKSEDLVIRRSFVTLGPP